MWVCLLGNQATAASQGTWRNQDVPMSEQTFAENLPPPGADAAPANTKTVPIPNKQPKEIGGRDGPEPTRYGDWEKNGRYIDF